MQCHLAPAVLEALEEEQEQEQEEQEQEEEASAEASKEVSKEAAAEADSVEASVVAVEAASEAVAVTLAPEAAIEAVTEADLEHQMEPRPALDWIEETEIEASLVVVVGMSLEAADAHMRTDLAATEMAAADLAIVTATATAIETETVTVTVIETARDVGLVATWNPLAAEKVGIGTGTMIALAMKTAGSEDTKVVATKTLESCAATKLDNWCKSIQVSTLGG